MKITMNIGDDLLKQVDECVKQNGMTRTSLFVFAVEQYLAQRKTVEAMNSLNVAMKRVSQTGEIDDEAKKQLDYFQFVVNSFGGK